MATWQDVQLGLKKEKTYGTAVTVDRFLEINSHGLDFTKGVVSSAAMGDKVQKASRRCFYVQNAGGPIEVEAASEGQGTWWEMLMGSGVSTAVDTTNSVYQQLFTLPDGVMPSFTIQTGIPRLDATTSAVDPYTYSGCVCSEFAVTFGNGELLKVSATVDGRNVVTSEELVTETLGAAVDAQLFCFKGASIYTDTLTVPTTTTLATGTTEMTNVMSGSLSVNHNLSSTRKFGGGGLKSKPTCGRHTITGSLEIEYDTTTWRDALLADTTKGLLVEYEASTAIHGSHYPTIQFVIPAIKLNGELPKPNAGDMIRQNLTFEGLYDGTNEPLYVVVLTSDSAL